MVSAALRAQAELELRRRRSQTSLPPEVTPEWAFPLRQPARFKGAYGGRAGGKSHYFAEQMVRRSLADTSLRAVCVREIQKSLKYSAKALIEEKIRALGVEHCFDILTTEIRRKGGSGLIIFQGMQDHTADSIKSLEGFGVAWVEEAQRLSGRSLDLLIPTIRAEGSEIWFSWNPDQPTDAVDKFLRADPPDKAIVVSVSYQQNPHVTQVTLDDARRTRLTDPDKYAHVWMGGYNVRSHLQVFAGKWRIDEFEPLPHWDGPYYGADWGFAQDPTTANEIWIDGDRLFITRESHEVELQLDAIGDRWRRDIPGIEKHVVRADNSRPETISHVSQKGIPLLVAADKWAGSVEDGIEFMRSFSEIVIHERCTYTAEEFRLYQWKTNQAGDPLPHPIDRHNHHIDDIRYGLQPIIRARSQHQHAPIAKPSTGNTRASIRSVWS